MRTLQQSPAKHAGTPNVAGFFDPRTFSVQYVVSDPETKQCAIIDPVLDYDEKSGATATHHADELLAFIREQGFEAQWILDTHPHADHFSAAQYLKEQTGAPSAIGGYVTGVQELWKGIYNWPDFPADGSQWDHLFRAGDEFRVGNLQGRVMFSPGHTLASVTYVIGDAAFVHDTIFQPDFGNAIGNGQLQRRAHALASPRASSRSTRRSSLPTVDLGRSSRISTCLGIL